MRNGEISTAPAVAVALVSGEVSLDDWCAILFCRIYGDGFAVNAIRQHQFADARQVRMYRHFARHFLTACRHVEFHLCLEGSPWVLSLAYLYLSATRRLADQVVCTSVFEHGRRAHLSHAVDLRLLEVIDGRQFRLPLSYAVLVRDIILPCALQGACLRACHNQIVTRLTRLDQSVEVVMLSVFKYGTTEVHHERQSLRTEQLHVAFLMRLAGDSIFSEIESVGLLAFIV